MTYNNGKLMQSSAYGGSALGTAAVNINVERPLPRGLCFHFLFLLTVLKSSGGGGGAADVLLNRPWAECKSPAPFSAEKQTMEMGEERATRWLGLTSCLLSERRACATSLNVRTCG